MRTPAQFTQLILYTLTMSVPSFGSSSHNQCSDAFAQKHEPGPDFFDQFLSLNPTDNEEKNYLALSDSNFFRNTCGDCGSVDTPSSSQDDGVNHGTIKDEAGGKLWSQSSELSQSNPIYPESSGRGAFSESEILGLEGITLSSPQIPTRLECYLPPSPSYDTATFTRRKSGISETPSKCFKGNNGSVERNLRNLRNSIRKANSFPKMIHASYKSNSDLWVTKPESSKLSLNFHGQAVSLSSSMCAGVSGAPERSRSGRFVNETMACPDVVFQHSSDGPRDFEMPLPIPVLYHRPVKRGDEHHVSNNSRFQSTPEFEYTSHEWSPIPSSLRLNTNRSPSFFASETDLPIWWNHTAMAPIAQPTPTAFHVSPLRETESAAMELQNIVPHCSIELPHRPYNMESGLMNQTTELPTEKPLTAQPSMPQQYHSSEFRPQHLGQSKNHAKDAPQRQPRLVRKPRFGPGELDSLFPSPSPELQVRKRKTQKPNKQTAPRTPSVGGQVGFVNYTPEDSEQILTGVAPSGSSKTKARREKEALERRRKFSEAAVRAVRAVGGDVKALVDEGLIV